MVNIEPSAILATFPIRVDLSAPATISELDLMSNRGRNGFVNFRRFYSIRMSRDRSRRVNALLF